MRQTSDSLILAFDDCQYYCIDSLFIIYSDLIELKYLMALLNSKLLNRHYQKLNPEKGRVFAQVKIDYVNEIPVVLSNDVVVKKVIELVDNILNSPDQSSESQKLIDTIVFKLYELTFDEVIEVEPRYWCSEIEYNNFIL